LRKVRRDEITKLTPEKTRENRAVHSRPTNNEVAKKRCCCYCWLFWLLHSCIRKSLSVMSLYGRFDYMDILSRSSRPRDDEDAATADVALEEGGEEDYLVLEDAAATTVAESEDYTTLPSEIHLSSLSSAASSDDETSYGATILPSLPSDEVARMQLEQQQLQALSMQVQGAGPRTTRNAHSTISLSTTESHFTEIIPDGLSTVSSLSLSSVSSLPSSFTEEIVFEEESTKSSNTSDDEESTLVKDIPVPLTYPRPSLFSRFSGMATTATTSNNQQGPWYANLKTEQDWETFRQECLVLMDAMGEDAPKNADEMIAQLIAEEEEVWYEKNAATAASAASGTIFGLSYETLTMLAGAALVPLVGYALASRNRRERVN